MALGSTPPYDATYALSHALRTVAEGGSKTKPVELTQVLSQIHAGVVAVPVPSVPTAGPVPATAMPLTYRVEQPKGKGK